MSWRCIINAASIGCERRAKSGTLWPARSIRNVIGEVAKKLAIQERDAIWWRDACLLYFQTFSKRPLPAGVEKPAKTLGRVQGEESCMVKGIIFHLSSTHCHCVS